MKNVLLVAVATLLSCSLFSQNLPVPTKWKIKKLGVSFGTDLDMIRGIDFDYMMQTAKGVDQSRFNNVVFQEDMVAGVCENPNIRLMAALEVPGLKNVELNFALNGVFNRYDGVFYHADEVQYAINNNEFEYVSVNTMTTELGLESSITRRFSVLNFLNFYVGVGTNLGYTFSGDMTINGNQWKTLQQNLNRPNTDIVSGNTYSDYVFESYDAKDAFHQRAFTHLGFGILLFKRLELGIDSRCGIGYRAVIDAPTKKTNLNSIALSARWVLK